jgi:hypothetical protein
MPKGGGGSADWGACRTGYSKHFRDRGTFLKLEFCIPLSLSHTSATGRAFLLCFHLVRVRETTVPVPIVPDS